jgi:hypothetical protein
LSLIISFLPRPGFPRRDDAKGFRYSLSVSQLQQAPVIGNSQTDEALFADAVRLVWIMHLQRIIEDGRGFLE